MNKIIDFIIRFKRFLPVENQVNILKTQCWHLLVKHKEAELAIKDAQNKFEKTKELAVSDFEKVRKFTLENTKKAIASLSSSIKNENMELDVKYQNAKVKVIEKEEAIDSLMTTLASVEKFGEDGFKF